MQRSLIPGRTVLKLAVVAFATFLAATLIAGCSDDSSGGSGQSLTDLAAGDCVAGIAAGATPGVGQPDLERVACDDASVQFRVRQLVVVETSGDEFPGDAFLQDFGVTTCGDDAPSPLVPTRQQWQSGDRMIVCLSNP